MRPNLTLEFRNANPSIEQSGSLGSHIPEIVPPSDSGFPFAIEPPAGFEGGVEEEGSSGVSCLIEQSDFSTPIDLGDVLFSVPVRFAAGVSAVVGRRGRGHRQLIKHSCSSGASRPRHRQLIKHGVLAKNWGRELEVGLVDEELIRDGKHRHLLDEDTDVILAEAATQSAVRHETHSLELSGVGVPLDSSGTQRANSAPQPRLSLPL
ncbi:UNVERIFIED_CONTAM: hypothetical protein Slati_4232400 [Sesamum latifolium]|uniref:Uncharacterized protein n=1 Tax=Sesamum latifolium TaxID=2727402 RepID=A0AAW2TAQ6_9LAMI